VPFAAGGPGDTLARSLTERMRESLGQTVIIENVTGAAGAIGTGRVARAEADGYTIGLGFLGTHVLNGTVQKLHYDILKDFEPIALLANNPHLIVAKNAMPANDLKGLVAWLQSNPGKASQGTGGMGTPSHVGGAFFQNVTGTRFQFVHYRGGAGPAMQDLVGGHIDLMFDQALNSLPHLRDGKIKVYAVADKARLPSAPDIPTVDEAGLPGLYISSWYGLWAPKGTPKEIIAKLNTAVVAALGDPTVRQRLAGLGLEIPRYEEQTPEALGAFQKAEIDRWWPIIKAASIKGE
jgi:tripartite-type tricarboxylate transporter receptor subunit TctC